VPLEREPSFAVEAAGYWATVKASGRGKGKQALETVVPATSFTVMAYQRAGRAAEKASEVRLGPRRQGDHWKVERGALRLRSGAQPQRQHGTLHPGRGQRGRVKHYGPLGVAVDTMVSRTHLVVEVPQDGGGIVVWDYGPRGQGFTNGTTLVLEGADGEPMEMTMQRN